MFWSERLSLSGMRDAPRSLCTCASGPGPGLGRCSKAPRFSRLQDAGGRGLGAGCACRYRAVHCSSAPSRQSRDTCVCMLTTCAHRPGNVSVCSPPCLHELDSSSPDVPTLCRRRPRAARSSPSCSPVHSAHRESPGSCHSRQLTEGPGLAPAQWLRLVDSGPLETAFPAGAE